MSTRCNVVIKKTNCKDVYLYHHHDGDPSGVGQDLTEYFEEILESDDKEDIVSTPESLAKWLCADERDDEYEETFGLHGDIEYLYEIYLDSDSIVCYDAWNWEEEEKEIKYTACIWDSWSEVKKEIELRTHLSTDDDNFFNDDEYIVDDEDDVFEVLNE